MSHKIIKIYTDGGARGNPGPAAIGIVIKDEHDQIIKTHAEAIGHATNNVAEYSAIIKALEIAKKLEPTEIHCYLDSELVVKQLRQEYKVKDPDLQKLFVKVWNLKLGYKKIFFTHIRRELNYEADKLLNLELDRL